MIAPALLLRLALFFIFPSVPETLANRVEISTPVTGFKRLQEGLFLYKHGVSPYDGGVYHQVWDRHLVRNRWWSNANTPTSTGPTVPRLLQHLQLDVCHQPYLYPRRLFCGTCFNGYFSFRSCSFQRTIHIKSERLPMGAVEGWTGVRQRE